MSDQGYLTMSLFDLRRYWSYRLGLFGSRFPSSIASFRPLIHPISSSGSEVMEFWLWSYHFFCLRATSQDPFHRVLSSFDAIDHLIISFQRAKDRPDRSTRSSDKAPSLYPSSSYSPPERSHHIPVILLSFFTVQHSIYIYFSTPFCSLHQFSTALLFSQSAPSWSVLQSSDIIWTYLSQIFVVFLYHGVILGCFSLVYPPRYHILAIPSSLPLLSYTFLLSPTPVCYFVFLIHHHHHLSLSLIGNQGDGFIRCVSLPSSWRFSSFFTVCHAFRRALGNVWNFLCG